MKKKQTRREAGTLDTLCAALELSKRRVSELLKQGMPDDPAAALAWRDSREDEQGAGVAELRRQRIRLVKAQARRAEIQADIEAGKLIPLEHAKAVEFSLAVCVRTALLDLQGSLPPELVGLPDERSIQRKLKERLYQILTNIADGDPRFWRARSDGYDLALEFLKQHAPEVLKP